MGEDARRADGMTNESQPPAMPLSARAAWTSGYAAGRTDELARQARESAEADALLDSPDVVAATRAYYVEKDGRLQAEAVARVLAELADEVAGLQGYGAFQWGEDALDHIQSLIAAKVPKP